jgi:Rps23 Pro-64 3,4-dihydroxylase Tpa1-like proline 4-hydroxylase
MAKIYNHEEEPLPTWLQPAYLKDEFLQKARALFTKNLPFPHAVFTNFFLNNKASTLRKVLLQESFTEKNSDLFSLHQTHDLHSSSNPLLQSFIQFFESSAFRTFLTQITGIEFAKTIDVSGSIYAPTNHLLPHNDLLEGRALAFSYYLTPGFTVKDGGELQLFSA